MNMPLLSPALKRVAAPLRQQVIDALRNAIQDGRFRPGARLGERELCEYTGVSRTSVREALRQLEAEGYVQMVPNKGPIVGVIGQEEARSIYQVRAVLEGLASRLFAENATIEQKRRLGTVMQKLYAAVSKSDTQLWLAAIQEFYAVLFDGAGNETLKAVLLPIQGRTQQLRSTVSMLSPERRRACCDELQAIVTAIEAGDADKAEAESAVHVNRAAEVAMTVITPASS